MFSRITRIGRTIAVKALKPLGVVRNILKRGPQKEVMALTHELRCSVCGGQIRVYKVRVLGKYVIVCDCGEGFELCEECAGKLEAIWPPEERR